MEDYRVRDPIHGFIHFDEIERKIIDSRPFQRLRNIKQLAFCYYVYPGAMHTRFEHSLGVMELATRVFDHFNNPRHPDHERFADSFGELDIKEARKLLRLTALLHDIGHLPYSHSGESILPQKKEHEDVSVAIIQKTEVAEIIGKNLSMDMVEKACLLISKGEVPSELRVLRQIISGQFDADRMDYLIRDSHHCGVGYGNFDYLRFVETLRVIPDRSTGGLQLAVERGGVHSLEALILARYFMFAQVYYHRTRRLYDIYLAEFLKSWGGIEIPENNLAIVLNYDDNLVWRNIEEAASNKSNPWAQRIYNRHDHHTLIYETNDHALSKELARALEAMDDIKRKHPDLDLILDGKAKGKIHDFYTEKEGEDYKQERDMKVIVADASKSLYEESKWLKTGPK